MSSQADLKRVRSLQQKKYREKEQVFLVEGWKGVEEVVRSNFEVEAIYTVHTSEERSKSIAASFPVHLLPAKEMDKLGTVSSKLEVLAVVRIPTEVIMPDLAKGPLMLALDGINDPGNLGTIIRVADWFGIDAVLVGEGSVDVFNPKCVRSSMGSMFRVPVISRDLVPLLTELQAKGAKLYKATAGGPSIYSIDVKLPAVIVLGSESHGISTEVEQVGGQVISIPAFGRAESLNVAMAATAICSEIRRGQAG